MINCRMDAITEEEFRKIVLASNSRKDILRKLGYKGTGSLMPLLNKRLEKFGLTEFVNERSKNTITKQAENLRSFWKLKRPVTDILVRMDRRLYGAEKNRIIESGILGNTCNECGCGNSWNGKSLVLQIDHINGDCNDHTLENLRLLCPNCHTQTENYAGKGLKKKFCKCGNTVSKFGNLCKSCSAKRRQENNGFRPSIEQMQEDLDNKRSISEMARKYGISRLATTNWLKRHGLYRSSTLKGEKNDKS